MKPKVREAKRTTLLAAILATVAVTATPALAMRDPSTGGMPMYNYGPTAPTPPRAGQAGLNGQYADGMNLYQYVKSAPTRYVDPTGLWSKDFHHDLTLELAKKAGIACAADVAAGCNRPDEDERDAPSSFKEAAKMILTAGILRQQGFWDLADKLEKEADRRIRQAAEWHFPADKDGVVTPNSAAANAKVDKGIKDCDFKLFSEGLHTLQDSWSHQGKPFMGGLGHARGAVHVTYLMNAAGLPAIFGPGQPPVVMYVDEGYKLLTGLDAATSPSADDVTIWPEDARAASAKTYEKMLEFKQSCPCACPGPNNTKVKTSSGKPEDKDAVDKWLLKKYPGENKVE